MTAAVSVPGPTVYLLAQPTVKRDGTQPDLRPLAEHGEVRTVIMAGENPSRHPARAMVTIAHRLAEYDPDRDLLAWAGGDTLTALLVGVALAQRNVTHVTWLRWEKGRDPRNPRVRTEEGSHYRPVRVPFLAMMANDPNDDEEEDDE